MFLAEYLCTNTKKEVPYRFDALFKQKKNKKSAFIFTGPNYL